jgi:hypothetical protein
MHRQVDTAVGVAHQARTDITPVHIRRRSERARELDHRADRHLAEGRHEVAERLSREADDIRLRLRRGTEHLADLGVRATFECLTEIGRTCHCTDQIVELLDAWRQIDPETLRALGGDRFPSLLTGVPK